MDVQLIQAKRAIIFFFTEMNISKGKFGELEDSSFSSVRTCTHLNAKSTEIPISQLSVSEHAQQRVQSDETSVSIRFHRECV